MKLSAADKALLITFSGAIFLVLVFFFVTVKPYEDPIPESYFEIPMVTEPEEEELTEDQKQQPENTQTKATTHQAFNANTLQKESKALFDAEDPVREAIAKNQLQSVHDLDKETETFLNDLEDSRALALLEKKAAIQEAIAQREAARVAAKGNRLSTVAYDLQGREAIRIPNPVYTCDYKGTIVLDIEVNSKGTITKMDFNKKTSTSSNGCLIDQALYYARQALFNQATATSQKGTLTFYFQG